MKSTWILLVGTLFLLGTPVLASSSDRFDGRGDLRQIARHADSREVRHDHQVQQRHEDPRRWKESRHDNRRLDDRSVARCRQDEHRHWNRHRHDGPQVVYRYAPPPRPVVRERVVLSPVIPPPAPYLVLQFSW